MGAQTELRILIVDDDQSILRGLSVIIGKFQLPLPARTVTCDNAADALEILATGGADLVITDLEMPGTGGLELIRAVRERDYCRRFIILTGYASFEFARQALRYQVNDYLLKPVDKQELYALIAELAGELAGVGENVAPDLPPLEVFSVGRAGGKYSPKLTAVLDYIDGHYTTDLSLNTISEALGITAGYICILFQQELHTTFLYYLDCLRLTKSARLLLGERDRIIREVAAASGFMNERHFYKVFKKRLGTTPGEFRETYGTI